MHVSASFREICEISGKVDVTFIGFPFVTSEGQEKRLTHSVRVDDIDLEDVENAIRHIRKEGGIWTSGPGEVWFMPWPPAAIEIRKAAE